MSEDFKVDVDYILFRLDNDYPSGYDYRVLRKAADIIRTLMEDSNV